MRWVFLDNRAFQGNISYLGPQQLDTEFHFQRTEFSPSTYRIQYLREQIPAIRCCGAYECDRERSSGKRTDRRCERQDCPAESGKMNHQQQRKDKSYFENAVIVAMAE